MNTARTSRLGFLALAASLLVCADFSAQAAQVYSRQLTAQQVNHAAGFLYTEVPGSPALRGSGVIARDGRLVFTCAHVLFDAGNWATVYRFSPGWHASGEPSSNQGVQARGFRHFTNYAASALNNGVNMPESFNLDFTVLYSNTSFGNAVGWYTDGAPLLESPVTPKRILGYPATVEFTGAPGGAFQHATPWFNNGALASAGSFRVFDGVSTGPGNSGGPVMAWDAQTQTEYLAGILVSGTQTSAGVYALDADAERMAGDALTAVDGVARRAFSNRQPLHLPDRHTTYSERAVTVKGFTGALRNIALSLAIDTSRRGDLDVYLVSPSGRTLWLFRHGTASAAAIRLKAKNVSTRFAGDKANGTWRLRMRDVRAGATATFRNVSLTITAPGG